MKTYVKRNVFTYKDTTYSKDILLRTTDICPCMKNLDYDIVDDAHMDTFDGKHSNMHICLTFKYMETDVDYDWDENPIEYNYEESRYVPIHYCPICGEKIEIIVEEIVDHTAELASMMEELVKLREKRASKKKRDRQYTLRETIREKMME